MDFFGGLYNNYLRFFSWEEVSFLFTGTGFLVVLNLVLSEGLLSFDNALVLAILVSHLPRDRNYRLGPLEMSIQNWALTSGLFGAYFFRLIAIGLGTYLIQFWFLQLIGGGYLIWLAYGHFTENDDSKREVAVCSQGFWATVIKVEFMDIAFSIDSILAALGISKRVWVVLTGGMIGILCMRLVAGVFVNMIERFPLLKHTGYMLVLLIGYRLIAEVDWKHFDELILYIGAPIVWGIVIAAFILWVAALIRPRKLIAFRKLIHLSAIALIFSWTGTKFEIHMSDLMFAVIMLTVFCSTFVFNDMYQNRLLQRGKPETGECSSTNRSETDRP
ncbi:MAG: hypothetical protein A2V65_02385 [Deltaproteobacteria bacterium RBG_13_49_15]|nr:MAG: hypothetical protein A2V65_02385 [Deltaproteobacteria bacterium RBG_13_49_15]